MDELEKFKSEINLVEFAISLGFSVLDATKSSKACTVLRGELGKIGISRDNDNHWVFYNFNMDSGGSIIDLIMQNKGCNLGAARKILRPWIGKKSENSYLELYKNPRRSSADRRKVALEFARVEPLKMVHVFLESREIESKIYLDKRFNGSIFQDKRNNVVFPHYDQDGISGLEKRNRNFWSFSEGGKKKLWFSRSTPSDERLVFSESAIDSLSYFQLKDDGVSQYFSIGGEMSDEQIELIGVVLNKNPHKKAVLAVDNDQTGLKYIDKLQEAHPQVPFVVDVPTQTDNDWNDCLVDLVSKKPLPAQTRLII